MGMTAISLQRAEQVALVIVSATRACGAAGCAARDRTRSYTARPRTTHCCTPSTRCPGRLRRPLQTGGSPRTARQLQAGRCLRRQVWLAEALNCAADLLGHQS